MHMNIKIYRYIVMVHNSTSHTIIFYKNHNIPHTPSLDAFDTNEYYDFKTRKDIAA